MFNLLVGILFVMFPLLPAEAEASASVAVTAAIKPSEPPFALSTPADEAIDEKEYHVPVLLNNSVEAYIEYFRTRGKRTYQRWLDNSAPYLHPMQEIFKHENLPEELAYVAMIESGFDSRAVSLAKATGPWQLMPDTARQYGLRSDQWVDERRDHIKSSHAAAQHFRDLHNRFGSWPLVLAAYNAGGGKVQRAMQRTGSSDFWDLKESVFLLRETKGYVPKFMAAALIARDPAAYGFRVPDVEPLRYDEVVIPASTDLGTVAYCTDSTYEMIKSLNPEIQGSITPPDDPRYILRIPEGKKKLFLARSTAYRDAAFPIPGEERTTFPLPLLTGQGREFRTGPEICSVFEIKVNLDAPTYQPVTNSYSTDTSPAFTDRGRSTLTEFPSTARAAQAQTVRLHQYLGPWALPFFSNVTDRRRCAHARHRSCPGCS